MMSLFSSELQAISKPEIHLLTQERCGIAFTGISGANNRSQNRIIGGLWIVYTHAGVSNVTILL